MKAQQVVGVLFSSAGRRVELLNLFRSDAAALGLQLRIVAADYRPQSSAACQAADRCVSVPRIDHPDFVDAVLRICLEERIQVLVPLHDGELLVYAQHRQRFADCGVRVVISSADVVAIARDKLLTAHGLAVAGVPVPRSATLEAVIADPAGWTWPVIAKPRSGSSSIGVQLVSDARALAMLPVDHGAYMVQERLTGREYTVNLFIDASGQLACAVPHQRLEVRAGEVSKGRTERHPLLCAIARRIASALPGARGALCFQAIVSDEGRVGVFEINARFGGGFPLAHRAGARFPQWLLEETTGRHCSAHDTWAENVMMLRFDAAVFLQATG